LLDYRRKVAGLYAGARQADADLVERWWRFRQERDELFRTHSQSALDAEQKTQFRGLGYYDYDPALRFVLPIEPHPAPLVVDVQLEHDGLVKMERFGRVRFRIGAENLSLSVFWLLGYGGGIFLPFRDATSGAETYGGGRYVLDTIKHADLGSVGPRLVVDFNYAYNPSCAYNSRWQCPLAPRENWLPVAIRAGELHFD
jgi:uncharacterized protein (DUF1684 family)